MLCFAKAQCYVPQKQINTDTASFFVASGDACFGLEEILCLNFSMSVLSLANVFK